MHSYPMLDDCILHILCIDKEVKLHIVIRIEQQLLECFLVELHDERSGEGREKREERYFLWFYYI
jgi:hypothetical protein